MPIEEKLILCNTTNCAMGCHALRYKWDRTQDMVSWINPVRYVVIIRLSFESSIIFDMI